MEYKVEIVESKSTPLMVGAILIIFGLLLALLGVNFITWALVIIGVLLVVGGVIGVFSTRKDGGNPAIFDILMVVFGIVLILIPNFFASVAMIMLAIFMIIVGVGALANAAGTTGNKIFSIIVGVLLIVGGGIAILNPLELANMITIILGAMMIVSGILVIVGKKFNA